MAFSFLYVISPRGRLPATEHAIRPRIIPDKVWARNPCGLLVRSVSLRQGILTPDRWRGRGASVWEFPRRGRNGRPSGCGRRFGQAESAWRQSCMGWEIVPAKATDLGLRLDDFGATRALDMVSALQFPFFQNWIVFGYIQYMEYRGKRDEHAIGDPPYGHLSFPPSHVYGGPTQRQHPQIYQK